MAIEDIRAGMGAFDAAGQDETRAADALDNRNDEVQIAQASTGDAPAGNDIAPVDAGGAPDQAAGQTAQAFPAEIEPDANNDVRLPAGVSLEDVKVEGTDLVLVQPDGSEIIIHNAAANVPTFFIDGVLIPQEALVAALEASDINVAAGPGGTLVASSGSEISSSGGNFGEPAPGIGEADPILDLLGPTGLQFDRPTFRELGSLTGPRLNFGDGFAEEDDLAMRLHESSQGNNEDLSVDAQMTAGSLVSNFGSGGPNSTDALSFLATPGGLTSQGEPITYVITDNGKGQLLEAFASSGGEDTPRLVFSIELVVNGNTGGYVFTLYDQLDNVGPGTTDDPSTGTVETAFEDIIDLGFVIQAKNGMDMTASDTLHIGVQDDIPVYLGEGQTFVVDEDDIDTDNDHGLFQSQFDGPGYHFAVHEGSLGTSPNDGAGIDGSYTDSPYNNGPGAAYIYGDLSSLFSIGSDEFPDEQQREGFEGPFSLVESGLDGLPTLTSKSETVEYKLVDNGDGTYTLFGYVADNQIEAKVALDESVSEDFTSAGSSSSWTCRQTAISSSVSMTSSIIRIRASVNRRPGSGPHRTRFLDADPVLGL